MSACTSPPGLLELIPARYRADGAANVPETVLVAMILALGMLTIDVTAVRVALRRSAGAWASNVEQQSVVNAYLLAVGVFVVAGGRAGDLFGRRRVFLSAWGCSLGRAMGSLTGTAAAGLSIGPLLGGVLIGVAGWRSIFFINVPLGVLAAIAVARYVPERRRDDAPRIDLAGLVTLALAERERCPGSG